MKARAEQVTVPDTERATLPAPAAEPFSWPDPLPPLSMQLLREIAEVLRERPVEGDGDVVWSLNGRVGEREFFRMSK